MARPTPVRTAVITATTSALVVLGLLAPMPAATAGSGSMYGAPKAGQCYRTPGKVAFRKPATQRPPVSCKKRHRLWIVKVKKVPKKIHVNAKKSNKRFWRFETNVCGKAYRLAIGTLDKRYGLSAYGRFSFIPTKKQRAHGAHWLSCELGVLSGGKRGMALKWNHRRHPPHLSMHPPKWIRLCATKRSILLSCSKKHRFRVSWAHGYKAHGHPKARARKMCTRRLGRHRTWVYAWRSVKGPSPWIASCLPR